MRQLLRRSLPCVSCVTVALTLIGGNGFAADSPTAPKTQRGYVAVRYGQLHYAISDPGTAAARRRTPVVMLHQTPNSLVEYGPLIAEMGRDRIAIAVDTKGAYEAHGVPDGAWALRADSLRPPATKREYGHHAAFEYAERARTELPKVSQPVLLLAVADNLEAATKNSASLFKHARLVDLPHIRTGSGVYDGVFYSHTAAIAAELRRFLD